MNCSQLASFFEGVSNYDEAARSYYALYSVRSAARGSNRKRWPHCEHIA